MFEIRISQNLGLLNIGMNFTTVVVIKKKCSSVKLFLPLLPIVKNTKTSIHCHGATVTTGKQAVTTGKKSHTEHLSASGGRNYEFRCAKTSSFANRHSLFLDQILCCTSWILLTSKTSHLEGFGEAPLKLLHSLSNIHCS